MRQAGEEGSLAHWRPGTPPRSKGRREGGLSERRTEQEGAERCGSRRAEELRSVRHEEEDRSRARSEAGGRRSGHRRKGERSLEAEHHRTCQDQPRRVHHVHREVCQAWDKSVTHSRR